MQLPTRPLDASWRLSQLLSLGACRIILLHPLSRLHHEMAAFFWQKTMDIKGRFWGETGMFGMDTGQQVRTPVVEGLLGLSIPASFVVTGRMAVEKFIRSLEWWVTCAAQNQRIRWELRCIQ